MIETDDGHDNNNAVDTDDINDEKQNAVERRRFAFRDIVTRRVVEKIARRNIAARY